MIHKFVENFNISVKIWNFWFLTWIYWTTDSRNAIINTTIIKANNLITTEVGIMKINFLSFTVNDSTFRLSQEKHHLPPFFYCILAFIMLQTINKTKVIKFQYLHASATLNCETLHEIQNLLYKNRSNKKIRSKINNQKKKKTGIVISFLPVINLWKMFFWLHELCERCVQKMHNVKKFLCNGDFISQCAYTGSAWLAQIYSEKT